MRPTLYTILDSSGQCLGRVATKNTARALMKLKDGDAVVAHYKDGNERRVIWRNAAGKLVEVAS